MEEHRLGKGSVFVRQYAVTRLVHVEAFDDPLSAITREKQLKKWNRDWKIRLIEEENLEMARSDASSRMRVLRVWVPAGACARTAQGADPSAGTTNW